MGTTTTTTVLVLVLVVVLVLLTLIRKKGPPLRHLHRHFCLGLSGAGFGGSRPTSAAQDKLSARIPSPTSPKTPLASPPSPLSLSPPPPSRWSKGATSPRLPPLPRLPPPVVALTAKRRFRLLGSPAMQTCCWKHATRLTTLVVAAITAATTAIL